MTTRRAVFDIRDNAECVLDGTTELARIIRAGYAPPKTTFVTPNEFRQQLGFIVYEAGAEIKRHRHNPIKREVIGTPEVVLVRSGQCFVDLFSEDEEFVASVRMWQGDVVVFASGGHGFRIMEDTVLMEVKQGPYSPESDKVYF